MPKGKTVPKGEACLGTIKAPTAGRLQVTYDGQPLYTFTGDTGTSLNGNGVGGFDAAVKVAGC
jgi:predicted lipoprotein with Yx(FWY)xxD motif